MRLRTWLLAAVTGAVLAAGCSSTNTAGTATTVGAGAATPLRELKIALTSDGTNVQGDKATVGMGSPNANIYERLTRMGDDFQVKPWLAERWEFLAPNTWRFSLRHDVTFQDGTPFTAKDVVWTFDRIARSGGRAINSAVGATKAIDDYTVEFTPSVPNKKVPLQLVHPIFGIMKAGSDPVTAPVGTGPLKFVSYTPKQSFVTDRYANYWDVANRAKVSRVTWQFIPDNNARVLAFKSGGVDAIVDVPRESVNDLKGKGLVVEQSPVGSYEALSIMVHGEGDFALTNDVTIRKAIAMAIDRKLIVSQVLEGLAQPGQSMVPPAILGPSQSMVQGGPAFDLAGSQRLLDDAGWIVGADGIRAKAGNRLELTLVNGFPSAEIHRPIPEVIKSQLAKAGIGVKIVEPADYDTFLTSRQGNLWLERGNQNDGNPAFLPNLLYTSEASGNKAGVDYARAFAPGADVDQPMAAAQASADLAATQQLTAQAMKALIDDDVVTIPIAGLTNIWAHSQKVTGLKPHAAFIHTLVAGASVAG